MHSSRMRTAHSLTIKGGMPAQGGVPAQGECLLGGGVPAKGGIPPPPFVDRQTLEKT